MKHGSLFSGIGGFDLAAQWMGWTNVFHCEINEFGRKVLNYYWPESISYEDIKKTDFTPHRGHIDILTGGFPCQPYSVAGKRKGKEDERHLWPEMLRAIREIKPRYIVGENVGGIVSWNGGMVFEEVQTDLEVEGYEVWAFILPACAKNAPHRRDRVWFIAYSNSCGNDNTVTSLGSNGQQQDSFEERSRGISETTRLSDERIVTNTDSASTEHEIQTGRNLFNGETIIGGVAPNPTQQGSGWKLQQRQGKGEFGGCDSPNTDTYSDTTRLQRSPFKRGSFERESGREEHSTRFLCPNWEVFPTEPPICGRNDGLSSRLAGITFSKFREQSIKAYGNAIVPQVALEIFKAIQKFDLLQ